MCRPLWPRRTPGVLATERSNKNDPNDAHDPGSPLRRCGHPGTRPVEEADHSEGAAGLW